MGTFLIFMSQTATNLASTMTSSFVTGKWENEECPHFLALDGAMLRFPGEIVAFQMREVREPGRVQHVDG